MFGKKQFVIWCLLAFSPTLWASPAQQDDTSKRTASDRAAMPQEPTGPLSFEQAAALALAYNPALKVFPWEIRAAEARALQASLWPNPEFAIEVEEIRLSGEPGTHTRAFLLDSSGPGVERAETEGGTAGLDNAEFTFRISQLFLLGGKRGKAVAVEERQRDATAWDYEIARVNVLRDVTRSYLVVLAAQETLTERRRILDLTEQVERTIAARVDSGKISPIERKRAEVQTTAAGIELERAKRKLEQARVVLSAIWGTTTPIFDSVTGDLLYAAAIPPLETLQLRSKTNPDIQRWQYEMARREAVLELERSRRIPDLTASLGFVTRKRNDLTTRGFGIGPDRFSFSRARVTVDDVRENLLEFEISLPLPMFNRNQGSIREAEHLVSKTQAERYVTLVDVKRALSEWHKQAMAAFEEIASLNGAALPPAREVFDAIRIGYEQGKFGFLEVLEAQRTLFDLRIQLLEAYSNYRQAVVELERLLGQTLDQAAERNGTRSVEKSGE